jgi:hypothetical protein
VPGLDGYYIDPNWTPVHIEYVYQWWGLGDPVLDHQQVDYQDGNYVNGEAVVPPERIKEFLNAIARLHPTQSLLAANDHTDDYPSWMIEMTDQDGNHVLLASSSTANPGQAPWNVLYNGRLYAQYDGSLGTPVQALFPGNPGQPAASYYPGSSSPNTVTFVSGGWLPELTQGFNGLLPLANGFSYQADLKEGKIEGDIEGSSSVGGFGDMILGTITKIDKIVLTASDGNANACDVQSVKSSDPSEASWKFACSVSDAVFDTTYRYPIEVTYRTKAGKPITTQGQLVGTWSTSTMTQYLPLPEELQNILAQNPVTRDLLTDHVPIGAIYETQMDEQSESKLGTTAGELILLGKTQFQGKTMRYSIATPFVTQNGVMTNWTLTRAALNNMLNEIEQLALTQRVLQLDPVPDLNMWYAGVGTMPSLPQLINDTSRNFSLQGSACGKIPTWSVPNDQQPLEAFSFNGYWDFNQPNFVLLDGRPIVNDIDLSPAEDDLGGMLPLLIPEKLDTGTHPPFDRIWFQANSYFDQQPQLTLWVPGDANVASNVIYSKIVALLPGVLYKEADTVWEEMGMTFVLQDDGTMGIIACTNH